MPRPKPTDKVWFRLTLKPFSPLFVDASRLGHALALLPPGVHPEISRVVPQDGQKLLPPPAKVKTKRGGSGVMRAKAGTPTRKVFDAVKRLGSSSPKEIALASRINVNTVSSTLNRFRRMGVVVHDIGAGKWRLAA
jgi:hypothetical protein